MIDRRRTPHPPPSPNLRQQAEARVSDQPTDVLAMPPRDVQALVHELQVHQVELEIQNEELRNAQMELAEARDRYLDLYQLAPVGYLTVDAQHVIREANLTASKFLYVDRADLIGRRLEKVVASEDRDACFRHLNLATAAESTLDVELRVNRTDGELRWMRLETTWHAPPLAAEEEWRVTLHDVTDRRLAEDSLRDLNQDLERRIAERTSMLELLNDVATAANDADSIEEALTYTLRRICEQHGWCFGHAYLRDPGDGDLLQPSQVYYEQPPNRFAAFRNAARKNPPRKGKGLPGRVYANAEPQWTDGPHADLAGDRPKTGLDPGIRCVAAFPILVGTQVVGVLEFISEKSLESTPPMLESMASIGMQLGRVVERQRFEHELSRALLDEQRSIGAELHDTVAQDLAAAALMADHVADRLRPQKSSEAKVIDELSTSVRAGLAKLRETVRGIIPPIGVNEPLRDILEELLASMQQRYNIECVLTATTPVIVGDPVAALHLYRIVSEAVGNAARHARATRIVVHLSQDGDAIKVKIQDDGTGMPPETAGRGAGLRIMRHRARMIDAQFDVRSSKGRGTEVICAVPTDRLHRCPTE